MRCFHTATRGNPLDAARTSYLLGIRILHEVDPRALAAYEVLFRGAGQELVALGAALFRDIDLA
jgi:hypothetical protein